MRGKVPAARLVGLGAEPTRKFGALAGQVAVSPAFFASLPATELRAREE